LVDRLVHFSAKAKGIFLFCLFLILPLTLFSKEFVVYDPILDERAAQKIEEMGEELFRKSGVKVFLIAKEKGGQDIVDYAKNFAKELSSPYVILTLFLTEQKVDIYHSKGLESQFDKEAMLSPLPWKGTIIPLLTNKKKEVGVSAALLNGYADIVDQIAAYRNITLESSIGSSNKTTISIVKLLVYGFVGVLVVLMIIRRIKERAKSKS